MFGINMSNIRIASIVKYIDALKALISGANIKPTIIERNANIKNAASDLFPIIGNTSPMPIIGNTSPSIETCGNITF